MDETYGRALAVYGKTLQLHAAMVEALQERLAAQEIQMRELQHAIMLLSQIVCIAYGKEVQRG